MHGKGFLSIWFFIGALLAIYGILIMGAGFSEIGNPAAHPVVMANLHAAIWWGALMLGLGVVYLVKFRPGKQ